MFTEHGTHLSMEGRYRTMYVTTKVARSKQVAWSQVYLCCLANSYGHCLVWRDHPNLCVVRQEKTQIVLSLICPHSSPVAMLYI